MTAVLAVVLNSQARSRCMWVVRAVKDIRCLPPALATRNIMLWELKLCLCSQSTPLRMSCWHTSKQTKKTANHQHMCVYIVHGTMLMGVKA